MAKAMIGVVGPCAAGKTTLIAGLKRLDYAARHIAQEHSFVPDMWKRISDPLVLVYLDVSFPVSLQRRPQNMNETEFAEQVSRLRHARQHADLYLHTDALSMEEVLDQVVDFLRARFTDRNI